MPRPFFSRPRMALTAALFVLSAGAALAQGTREQEEACAPDAVRLCAATIPDVPKTTACMKSHVADLSPRCRTMFNAATNDGGTKAVAAKPATASPKPAPRRAAAQPTRDKRDVAAEAPRQPRKTVVRSETPRDDRRHVRTVAIPTRRAPEATLPDAPPAPIVAQPAPPVFRSRVPGLEGVAASIAQSCREGLIDPFTCRNTFDALRSTE